MATDAVAGVGTLFQRYSGLAWVTIAEVNSIEGPAEDKDVIDVTSLDTQGGYDEFITGFINGGTVTLNMNFTRSTYELMKSDFEIDVIRDYRIVLPDDEGTILTFEGLVTEIPITAEADNQLTADVMIQISGQVAIDVVEASSALSVVTTSNTTQTVTATIVGAGYDGVSYEYSDDNGVTWTEHGTAIGGTYNATGLIANTLYYWRARLYVGSNYSPYSTTASAYTWTTEYDTLWDALTGTKPSQELADKQNLFYRRLLGDNTHSRNTYAKFACAIWYNSGMPTASDALFWINNPARKATLNGVPNPTYVLGSGFRGDGANSYIDTTFNLSTDGGGIYTQNSASHGTLFSNAREKNESSGCGGVTATNWGTNTSVKVAGSRYEGVNSNGTNACNISLDVKNWHIYTRINNTTCTPYRNKVPLVNVTKASVALQNVTQYDLAIYVAGTGATSFSTDTVAFKFYGSTLDQTDVDVIVDAMDEFLNKEIWHGAGICLDFADLARIDSWIAVDAAYVAAYGWKSTFAINGIEANFNTDKAKIESLVANGHEIANHTAGHIDWVTYLLTHTDAEFYANQIYPAQNGFANVFNWKPTTFAYAQNNGHDVSLDAYILAYPDHFNKILGVVDTPSAYTDSFIYSNNSSRFIWAVDYAQHWNDMPGILQAIDDAKAADAIFVLALHSIGGVGDPDSQFVISRASLESILQKVNDNGMYFYRYDELPVT